LEDSLKRFLVTLAVIAITGSLLAQDIQVNRQNKTISVTADESATADAEIAVLAIGYHNYGPTQDAAFQENVRAAERITKALLDAKVPKANIETERLQLARKEIDEKWTADMKKERQFVAEQSWHVTVSASEAQAVVDLAVKAGANEVDDVDWNVADPIALQAKAGGAALAKARSIADQMAKGLGTKLGELVYASNRAPVAKMWRGMTVNAMSSAALSSTAEKQPKLTLFPQKVMSQATVYAVFSIE
jgi:uncharacterized protein YggE